MSRVEKENPIEEIQYRPLHALHFEELSRIWEADRRIPTISSRRHWAEARNVNPVNVHSWWYRRRPLAKKLKIKIPREEYDLDVGTPPLLPDIEEIKVEVPSEVPISDLSQTLSPLPGISDAETSIPSSNAVDVVENSSSDDLSAECMRSSSPLQEIPWLAPSSTSRDSSPLPPSSPCPPTPPPCLLTLPEDIIVKDDTAGPLLDPTQAELEKICSSTLYAPHSFSRLLETSNLTKKYLSLPLFPTWCLTGYRIAYDGSFLGFCSCCTDDPAEMSTP